MKESIDAIGFDSSAIVYDAELVKKTLWFDEELYGTNMTDFFNKRPTEYSKGTAITADDLF
jgi:ribonucleotide reductase beta subunit family protein with ferritin-like domain